MFDPKQMQELTHALFTWSRADPHGFRAGGVPEGYTSFQFHHRPDPQRPEVQLTFLAALVDGEAVIQVMLPPPPPADSEERRQGSAVSLGVVGPSPREPDATCEGCGTTGTIGRAVRIDGDGNATETHRFCLTCWPEQSARYRARWEDEDRRSADDFFRGRREAQAGPGMTFEASTWHGTLDFVRLIERSMIAQIPPSPPDLAKIAADIQARAPEVEGEMPFEIESFIRRYAASAT